MIIYDQTGKKLIKIDALSDNYDYLLDSLKLNNIAKFMKSVATRSLNLA